MPVVLRTYQVRPALPPALAPLDAIARNLWWSWNSAAAELFRRLDHDLWEAIDHNPLALLSRVSQTQLDAAAADDSFLSHLDGIATALNNYIEGSRTWYRRNIGSQPLAKKKLPAEQFPSQRIAYFSAEFGIASCVPIYSGGLGILAGDHLKSASDLGLPLVGVSLLYREAFHQQLNSDGWQQESHPPTDLSLLPVTLQLDSKGQPLKVRCDLPGRAMFAQVWLLNVGRVPLVLLDSDLPENAVEDRRVTDRLYGGDLEMRIRQEILLGIGGLRALDALNLAPAVCHMNEGHSAFLALERVRQLIERNGLTFAEASELASAGNVFTTHTPVPAGNDRFSPELIEKYFADWLDALGISRDEFLALGREDTTDTAESFCMTVLALKLAAKANGVSKLHGTVSRNMWKRLYPEVPQAEIPIGSITNGIHQRSFIAEDLRHLYDSYLGPAWVSEPEDPATWERIDRIPSSELWRSHQRERERLVGFARKRLAVQVGRRGGDEHAIAQAAEVLDPQALTIGFARRFAAYKRATLVLRDPDRLAKILNNPKRPVQILFAGKAHQKDEAGKEIIRKVVHLAALPEFRNRIVFIEDYDIHVARVLVQGVDVWLNTPLRPLEASGTSGMKAVVNGAIHVSALDGWWAEAYTPAVGWAIGEAAEGLDKDAAEKIEADMLYRQLETEIVPLFYHRGEDGMPREWVDRMKASIRTLAPVFNTQRMVREYYDSAYVPVGQRRDRLAEKGAQRAKGLATYKQRIAQAWAGVEVKSVDANTNDLVVGKPLSVSATVALGDLTPTEVDVQLYSGMVDARGELVEGIATSMKTSDGQRYSAQLTSAQSGRFGFSVRVVPHHEDLASPFGIVPLRWG